MGVKVYYSEISAHKEVKKRQQKVMMILESKAIPYEAIDITEPGKESDKDFMLTNGKPKGDSTCVLSPQIFNDEVYCGDYEDFETANENDELEKFLNVEKRVQNGSRNNNGTNGASRESSAEKEAAVKAAEQDNVNANPVTVSTNDEPRPDPIQMLDEEPEEPVYPDPEFQEEDGERED